MKTKNKKTSSYSKLKQKTFLKGALLTAFAAAAVILLRFLSYGKLADAVVAGIAALLSIDPYQVLIAYQDIFSGNINYIMAIFILIFMLLLFRVLLGSYTAYLNQVVAGIDQVSTTNEDDISLSPELEFVEKKLNHLNKTLVRQEKEAKQMEQKKNDLVVYLAHDLKTPLTSILGYLSLLEMDTDRRIEEAEKEKYIRIAIEKAERLEQLINEFSQITQYSLHTVPLHKERIDLSYMMLQICEEVYPMLMESGKHTELQIPENLIVQGAPDKLARVFHNLIKNAIAYSDPGSTITISAKAFWEKAVIIIKSKGDVPKDKLETIFDKFNRLDHARSTATGGSGLGLAIAKEIVDLHSGTIKADTDGESTFFIIELPTE